jgi:hypothetical protein
MTVTKKDARVFAARIEEIRRCVVARHRNTASSKAIPKPEREEAMAMLTAQEKALSVCHGLLTGTAKIK